MSTLKVNSIQPLSSTGAVTIGGSVVVSGSETFNNIGPSKFVGNLIISNGSITGSNVVNINGQASEFSLANGQYVTASGQFSHAEGLQTLASGDYSHAEGRLTQAIGNYSHAEGFGTIAAVPYQHVQGKFNQTSSVQAAFIIGNGDGPGSESNLVFAAENSFQISGSLNVSGTDHTIQGLLTSSQTNVVTINPSTGLLSYAPSLIESVALNISCSNTSSATTTILNYGVNVIGYSTTTNYACKLPQPVTGRRVTIVNKSIMTIQVYPSNVGGQINNYAIDAPVIIPPDGNTYEFICIENPLPGAWTFSAPAINQYDSQEISINTNIFTSSINTIAAASPSYVGVRQGFYQSSTWGYDGLNLPPISSGGSSTPYPQTFYDPRFKPTVPWNTITKIKVYTNIIPSQSAVVARLPVGQVINLYYANTTTFTDTTDGAIAVSDYVQPWVLSNIIPGVVTTSSAFLSVNVGDPGTCWGERIVTPATYNSGMFSSTVGDYFVSSDGTFDTWINSAIQMNLGLSGSTFDQISGSVKFRFFFEYN